MSELRVYKSDVMAAGYCAAGMREWCRLRGFTSEDVRNGIPAEVMLATGCEQAAAVVRQAEKRAALEAGGAAE
ncbi:hypothetical protein [Paracoccus sanguinis]|nr:hypothetical protein [Paracoccus sanguinis]